MLKVPCGHAMAAARRTALSGGAAPATL